MTRETEKRLRRAYCWDRVRQSVPAVNWLLIVAGVLVASVKFAPLSLWRGLTTPDYLDAAGAPLRTGTGIVTTLGPLSAPGEYHDGLPTPVSLPIRVRMGGRDLCAETAAPVRRGEQVRVTYRVGRSGALCVGRVEPLPLHARP